MFSFVLLFYNEVFGEWQEMQGMALEHNILTHTRGGRVLVVFSLVCLLSLAFVDPCSLHRSVEVPMLLSRVNGAVA